MARKQTVTEVLDLVKAYARQELLDPLKGAPRWLAVGIGGSIAVAIGLLLLTLSMLRALQTETGSMFTGNLSWIPYLLVVVALMIVMAILVSRVTKKGLE